MLHAELCFLLWRSISHLRFVQIVNDNVIVEYLWLKPLSCMNEIRNNLTETYHRARSCVACNIRLPALQIKIITELCTDYPVNSIALSTDSSNKFLLTLASERYTIYFDTGRKPEHICI